MLAANEAVARVAEQRKLPMVYRVHAPPDQTKLAQLASVAEALGVTVDPEKLVNPRGVQKFLSKTAAHPRRQALHMFMLRSLTQAQYGVENVGHFALASDAYTHFTSPIRRYPDLIAHRVIKAMLAREGGLCGPLPAPPMPEREQTQEQAIRSSLRERSTAEAERESKSLFAAVYMRDRIGEPRARARRAVSGRHDRGAGDRAAQRARADGRRPDRRRGDRRERAAAQGRVRVRDAARDLSR
jgi:ribonuclease R